MDTNVVFQGVKGDTEEENIHGSIAFSSAEVTSDWLAQEVSHMRSRRQANLAK